MRTCLSALVLLLAGAALAQSAETPLPVSGRAVTESAVLPADVFARVRLVRDELELVRFEMGRPPATQVPFVVTGAGPREVYYQAETLFTRADRLTFELARESEPTAPHATGQLAPYHVFRMVDAALSRVRTAKKRLGISQPVVETAAPGSTTPSEVFTSIVQANRQLNLLLREQLSPSDVYQRVTLAVGLTARLLSRFPDATRLPPEPALERGKRSSDVYGQLTTCFHLVESIMTASGQSTLKVSDGAVLVDPGPSDVYHLAQMIVAELSHLHHVSGDEKRPRAWYPGLRFPSHVYQRAGMLEAQLKSLKELATQNPDWLK